jgi:hypothetical protein
MSNYTQSTFFTPKDSLTPGDPLKIIKGADVDPELSAISTAIATKVDTAGDGISISTTTASVAWDGLTALGAAPAAGDLLAIADISNSNAIRSITLTNLADLLAGVVTSTGLSDASGVLTVDINNTTEQTGIEGATDFLLMYDASAGALRKVSIDDAFAGAGGSVPDTRTLTAGSGLTGGGTLAADRTFNVGAGDGISVAADSVALDINGLTSAVAVLTDTIAIYDASAGGVRKESLTDIKTLVAPSTATTSAEGVVELATQTEVDAGTDTSRVVTPATLAGYTGSSQVRMSDTTGYDFRSVSTFTTIDDGQSGAWTWDLVNGGIYHFYAWVYWTTATQDCEAQLAFSANHFSTGRKAYDSSPTGYSPTISVSSGFNADISLSSMSGPGAGLQEVWLAIEPSADGTLAYQVRQTVGAANESMIEHGSWARLVRVA